MDRRDFLIGGACLATSAAAFALVPRRRQLLLGAGTFEAIVPTAFSGWVSREAPDLVGATEPGSVAATIYNSLVGRIYTRNKTGEELMLLLAYGASQTNDLQLHRPEVCYPAFGYRLTNNHTTDISLPGAQPIPARTLVAATDGETETVLYWTRLGEFFPTDHKIQQWDRIRTAMAGAVADGVLARLSLTGPDASASLALARVFASDLIGAVSPANRAVLIGTARASEMARAAIGPTKG